MRPWERAGVAIPPSFEPKALFDQMESFDGGKSSGG
jgi:hypothetical protein